MEPLIDAARCRCSRRARVTVRPTSFRSSAQSGYSLASYAGFTLIELLIVSAIFAILIVLGVARYNDHKEEVRVQQAVADILSMSALITQYLNDNHTAPDSLADVRLQDKIDPWGHPYMYTNLMSPATAGDARKDKNLHPLNSDFDLYSMGADGDTKRPLTAKVSRDDIIRARDGRFVGFAKDFDP